jgi:hypothetical protein
MTKPELQEVTARRRRSVVDSGRISWQLGDAGHADRMRVIGHQDVVLEVTS